ncbi:hypothetical protein [Haloarcula sebkhae]|nr:hypothetical protein [Haloarcula sebkhae]
MAKGKRVVFVTQRYPPDKGGNAARIGDMASNFVDTKWFVTVLTLPPTYPPWSFDRSVEQRSTESREEVTVHCL